MGWRRILNFGLVFGLGVAVGGTILHNVTNRPLDLSTAQRRALQVLSKPSMMPGIGDNPIVTAVQRIEPAVVNIDTVGLAHGDDDSGVSWQFDQEVRGKGSGVILTSDGYVVTNNHVIEGAKRIRVTLPNGQWYYAHLIGRDPDTDLAVVRIDANNLPTATLGDSDSLKVGEWSIAVGNPLGLGSTITVGVISALNRRNLQIEEGRNLDGAIQTDAAINRGNSGGALANINGQLVGINTAILSSGPNGGSIGLGFAIPANTVRRVARDLIANGKAPRSVAQTPWLGVSYEPLRADLGQELGLPPDQGVRIRKVLPETPASLAGLEDGDVLLSIDGKAIGDGKDVQDAVSQCRVGTKISIRLLRPSERRERTYFVQIKARPDSVFP